MCHSNTNKEKASEAIPILNKLKNNQYGLSDEQKLPKKIKSTKKVWGNRNSSTLS